MLNPIANHRAQVKLSQKALATKVGVSQTLLSFWETGKHSPKIEQIQSLNEVFGLSKGSLKRKMTRWINQQNVSMMEAST